MRVFAVIRSRGAAWQPSLPLEEQPEWEAHARFMDVLQTQGAIVLGGPLEGTPDVLLIMRANNPEEVASYLKDDPWTGLDLLHLKQITPWALRLGILANSEASR